MRPQDVKIQKFARANGMLVMRKGTEYGECVRKDGKEMSFEYSNPDECAHVAVTPKKGRTRY